jgi:hypothetical protein
MNTGHLQVERAQAYYLQQHISEFTIGKPSNSAASVKLAQIRFGFVSRITANGIYVRGQKNNGQPFSSRNATTIFLSNEELSA